MKTQIILLLALLLTSSCSTPYQPNGFRGGYSEELVGEDTFEVTFTGNGYIGPLTTQRYLKRRCAELAIKNGFTHYLVVDNNLEEYGKPRGRVTIKLVNTPSREVVAYNAEMVLKSVKED